MGLNSNIGIRGMGGGATTVMGMGWSYTTLCSASAVSYRVAVIRETAMHMILRLAWHILMGNHSGPI